MKAVGNGTAKVVAIAEDNTKNAFKRCEVTATVLVSDFWFDYDEHTMHHYQYMQMGYTWTPWNAKNPSLSWKSSNKDIATVDQNGTVYSNNGIWNGSTWISGTTTDGSNITRSFLVHVKEAFVEGISLSPSNLSLNVGDGCGLSWTMWPSYAANHSIWWSSSNESVATVNGGWVTAKGAGACTITATTYPGHSASCTVTVTGNASSGGGNNTAKVTGVTLNTNKKTMYKGYTYHLTATVSPSDAANKKVTWSSSNTKILTVDEKTGEIKAKAKGSATITVKTKDGGKTASCKVTVTDAPKGSIKITSIAFTPASTKMSVGDTRILSYLISPTYASYQTVTWSSGDESIATVNSRTGEVTAKAKGKVRITAKAADGGGAKGSCEVTVVNAIKLTEITIDSVTLEQGETKELNIKYTPHNAKNKELSYNNTQGHIVYVSNEGTVTGGSIPGTAIITATAKDGSKVSDSVLVDVSVKSLEWVRLNKYSMQLNVGKSENLIGTYSPADASYTWFSWGSDNPSVAVVDGNGKVTGKSAGTANISLVFAEITVTCQVTVKSNPSSGGGGNGGSNGGNNNNGGNSSGGGNNNGTSGGNDKNNTPTNPPDNKNCPIIIIPGIMGSKLYAHSWTGGHTSNLLWPPEIPNGLLYLDQLEIGKGNISIANWPKDARKEKEYGAENLYEELIVQLCNKFPNRAVYFYPYDWRKSNTESALYLNHYINEILNNQHPKHTKVDIVAHSMGGLVTSSYYQQFGNSKVRKIVTLGTPYEGAPKLIDVVLDGELLGFPRDQVLGLLGMNREVKAGFPALAELSPTLQYYSRNPFYKLSDSKYKQMSLYDYDNLMYNPVFGVNWGGAKSFHNSIKSSSINVLASYSNAYFIVGAGNQTINQLYFNDKKDLKKLKVEDRVYDRNADGTVPEDSATMLGILSGKVYRYNAEHTELVSNSNTINKVKEILGK